VSIIVTVCFAGEPERADAVLREHPSIAKAVEKAAVDHGLLSSRRYVRDGEFLEIDEWEREEDRDAFLADVGPYLQRWNELAGITDMQSTVWRPVRRDVH
jgi:hypothetical protein